MKVNRNVFFVVIILLATISGFIAGQFLFEPQPAAPQVKIRAIVPETPRKLALPTLQRDSGSLDMADLEGKWSLIFFGFMNCPDICPATLNTVAQAKKQFEQAGAEFPQVVFISVDPYRDNVKDLGEYVRYFDEAFIGATGEEKLLTAITVQTDSTFMTVPSENPQEYKVGHSANLILINPSVELVAVLGAPHSVESVIDSLNHFKQ
jgi:protein SCO1/2